VNVLNEKCTQILIGKRYGKRETASVRVQEILKLILEKYVSKFRKEWTELR